ncbi:hypothetical protein [Sebaldella sp. S0638]|uniref:hypothetical protein n=1 Tax=Sebaldella sp. S0638 TaxID=2957809 RepID=UPI00209D3136|nr:hypothetical protein [Sebaldella sp. S0638]MCP1226457.1 hypothetical protein [Sebaldella sp. S0638]
MCPLFHTNTRGYLLVIDNGQSEKGLISLVLENKFITFVFGISKTLLGTLGVINGIETIGASEGNGFVFTYGLSTTVSSVDLLGSGIIDIWNALSDNTEDNGTYPIVDIAGTLGGSVLGKIGSFYDKEDTWEQYGIIVGRGAMNTFEFISLAGGIKDLGKGIARSSKEMEFVFKFNKKQNGILKAVGEATFEGITENGLITKLAAQGSDLNAGITMLLTDIKFEELETIDRIKEIKEYERENIN